MNFLNRRAAARSRRSTRLTVLRLRRTIFAAVFLTALSGLGFYGHSQDLGGRAAQWINQKTLAVTASSGFRVAEILVTGRRQIAQEELLAKLNIREGAPIFDVSVGEAQRNLQQIPWVKSVNVSRRLPDKIVIEIQERAPAALWQYQKKLSLIDAEGRSLTSQGLEQWQNLPLLVGEDAPLHVVELTTLLRAEETLARRLKSAVRVGGRRWDLHFENGLVVRLPEKDAEPALRRLSLEEERSGIFKKAIAVIDLRLAGKMTLTPGRSGGKTDT